MAQKKTKKKKKAARPAVILNANGKPASAGVSKFLRTPKPELERKRDESKRILDELEAMEKNPAVFSQTDGALVDASALPQGIGSLLSEEMKEGETIESLSYRDLWLKVRHIFRMSNAALGYLDIQADKATVQQFLNTPGLSALVDPILIGSSPALSSTSICSVIARKKD